MAKQSTDIIAMTEEQFDKLPALPKGARDVIFKLTPWLALIFGALGVLGSLVALGILGALSPLIMLGGGGKLPFVTILIGLVSSVLLLVATPHLFAKRMQGWKLLFWSEVVSVVSAVVSLSLTGVLFGLLGVYLIFQIKSYYK